MTKFEGTFSGQTTGGGGGLGLIGAVVGGGVVLAVLAAAVRAIPVYAWALVATGVVALGWWARKNNRADREALAASFAAHREAEAAERAERLAARQSRAIAPAPAVNVNIDAGLLAGLWHAAQQQAAPVIVPSEAEEITR